MKKRLFALAIIVTLVVSCLSGVDVHAEDNISEIQIQTEESLSEDNSSYINPIYEDVFNQEQWSEIENHTYEESISTYSEPEYFTTEAEVIIALRNAMVNRRDVTIYYQTTENLDWNVKNNEFVEAAWQETGNEKEGDYLRWHVLKENGSKGGKKIGDIYYYTLKFSFTYLSTTEQEEEIDEAIDSVYEELGLNDTSMSDYQKVKIIYDYICKNVTYDHANDDTYLLKYSAYAALINKSAVCQGYSTLLYRLLTKAGISVRVITGSGGGSGHAWNIVALGRKYYYLDSTWDAGRDSYQYFLKGSDSFAGHTNDSEYVTDDFRELYPISTQDWLISLNLSKMSMAVGDTQSLTVEHVAGIDSETSEFIWSSSDPSTATVTNGNVSAVGAGTAVITVSCGDYTADCVVTVTDNISVEYRTHVQSYGWQDYVENGALSGTSGQAKRLEAIRIRLKNQVYEGDIEYQSHVQSYGWQNYVKNDAVSGTSGQAKRLEAISIRLTGEMKKHYDIYYRVHVQSYGWLGWAKNGAYAGTAGYAKRLEAIEIKLVKKDAAAPGSEENSYLHPYIRYQTHIQSYGWQGWKKDGELSGTSGQAKRLEGIRIELTNQEYEGSITYQTHVQSYGWQDWVTEGKVSGTVGKAKRLEAIKIKLTDEMEEHYDIYYRVHVQSYGWLGWAKNGEPAGTEGFGKRLEAIQIKLVEKDSTAPGSVTNSFIKKQ